MLAATPARQRSVLSQSHPPSSARSRGTTRTVEVPELPEYQPPEAPLTAEAHRQLATLQNSAQLRNLKTHLEHTAEKLTVSASDVNDRLFDARLRYEKQRQRQRDAGEDVPDDEDNGELQQLAEQERKVEEVTGQMEVKMRQMIDSEARLQNLLETVQNIDREEGEAQAAASRAGQARGQRRRTRQDDEGDDDDERDEYHETTPEREIRERNARNPPSRRLDTSLGEGVDKWNELSLTERYAGHNSYVGFYRVVHDSKFPSEAVPPLPHSSTWFSHLEDTSARASTSTAGTPSRRNHNKREPSPAESDDVAIERERISLKCPLTLLPFRDPVTSTKCPHSFEREAIHDMIQRSNFQIPPPPNRGGRRIRAVKCPVCSIPLTAEDLRSDPVMLRKVRRAEELSAREEEDQLDGSQQQSQQSGRVTLASDAVDVDDTMDVDEDEDDQPRVKAEPGLEESEESGSEEEDLDTE